MKTLPHLCPSVFHLCSIRAQSLRSKSTSIPTRPATPAPPPRSSPRHQPPVHRLNLLPRPRVPTQKFQTRRHARVVRKTLDPHPPPHLRPPPSRSTNTSRICSSFTPCSGSFAPPCAPPGLSSLPVSSIVARTEPRIPNPATPQFHFDARTHKAPQAPPAILRQKPPALRGQIQRTRPRSRPRNHRQGHRLCKTAGQHRPILVDEILAFLDPQPGQRGADVTLGYGGHTQAILEKLAPTGQLLALDVDSQQLPKTGARLRKLGYTEEILTVRQSNYAGLSKTLTTIGWPRRPRLPPRRLRPLLDADRQPRPRLFLQTRRPARHAHDPPTAAPPPPTGSPTPTRKKLARTLAEGGDEPHAKPIAAAIKQSTDPITTNPPTPPHHPIRPPRRTRRRRPRHHRRPRFSGGPHRRQRRVHRHRRLPKHNSPTASDPEPGSPS